MMYDELFFLKQLFDLEKCKSYSLKTDKHL